MTTCVVEVGFRGTEHSSWLPGEFPCPVQLRESIQCSPKSEVLRSRRVHRLATPPPSYTSVDDLNNTETQNPPTYEEATRIDIEGVEVVEVEAEEAKDEVATIQEPASSEDERILNPPPTEATEDVEVE